MTADELLRVCGELGIGLEPQGADGLAVSATEDVLTPALVAQLKRYKADLLELLLPPAATAGGELGGMLDLGEFVQRCERTRGVQWVRGDEPWPAPPADVIQHKLRNCTAADCWEHLWGGRYCCVCWPCTDVAMMVQAPGRPAENPRNPEIVC